MQPKLILNSLSRPGWSSICDFVAILLPLSLEYWGNSYAPPHLETQVKPITLVIVNYILPPFMLAIFNARFYATLILLIVSSVYLYFFSSPTWQNLAFCSSIFTEPLSVFILVKNTLQGGMLMWTMNHQPVPAISVQCKSGPLP